MYNDSGLFNTSNCGMNDGIEGENDIAPVISVFDETTDGGSETITITYHTVREKLIIASNVYTLCVCVCVCM